MQRVDACVLAEGELTGLKTGLLQGPVATKQKQAAQTWCSKSLLKKVERKTAV